MAWRPITRGHKGLPRPGAKRAVWWPGLPSPEANMPVQLVRPRAVWSVRGHGIGVRCAHTAWHVVQLEVRWRRWSGGGVYTESSHDSRHIHPTRRDGRRWTGTARRRWRQNSPMLRGGSAVEADEEDEKTALVVLHDEEDLRYTPRQQKQDGTRPAGWLTERGA
jgi:hypothetical protein